MGGKIINEKFVVEKFNGFFFKIIVDDKNINFKIF